MPIDGGDKPRRPRNREDVPIKLLRTASHLALTSAILSGAIAFGAIAAPAAAQVTAFKADEAYKIGGYSFHGALCGNSVSASCNF